MPVQITDLLGKVKRPVRSVAVCLDGDLWARHDDLSREIDSVRAQNPGKMGDAPGVADLAKELRDVETAMRAAEATFTFRGLSTYKRDELIERFPSKSGGFDTIKGAHVFMAAAAVEPAMTEDEAHQLLDAVHHAAAAKLWNCAWTATEGSADVPFSVRAFASTSASG